MNEKYLTGLHAHLGVKDDYDTWVNAVKDNEEYLRGLHNSIGVKDEYEDWYSAVWGDASKKKDDGESPSEEVELVGVSPSELPSIDEQIERLRGLRGSDVRIIEGQDPSSVMMGTSEADGRFFAHPTLFPRDPDGVTGFGEEDWLQLEGNEAFDEAMMRGELFEFASEEEADLFAKGAWKFTGKEAQFDADVASEKVRQAQEKVDEFRLDGGDLESEEFAQLVAEAEAAVAEEEAALGTLGQSQFEETNRINAEFGRLVDQEVTPSLIDRGDESQLVREMNMRFGEYGFTFDTSSFFGDAMTVTADNGEQIDVNLDPWTSGTEYDESEKLRAFLKKNKVDSELLLQERDLYESDLLLNQTLLRAKRDEAAFLEAEKALTDFIKEKGTELNEQDYAVYEDLFGKYDEAGKKIVASNEEFQSELILFNEELEQYNKARGPKGEKLRALERTFGDNEVSDWMGDMDNSVEKGQAQGGTIRSSYNLLTNANDVTDEEILDYLRAQETLQAEGHSDEFEKFMRIYKAGGESFSSFASALMQVETATVLPELFLSSSAAMLNPEVLNAALVGFGTGAAIGSAGFSLGPLGVLTTFGTGITMAMVAAGTALETGLSFGEFLNEELAAKQGVALEDIDMSVEAIREVLSDPEAMSRIRYRSGGRGIAIGTVNAIGAKGAVGAGMRVSKNLRRGRRFFAGATTASVGMIGEGLGESAGRFVAGQKQDVAEIGLEALAPAPLTVAATAYTLLKTPQYTLNGETVSGRAMVDFVRNASEADVAGATIEIKNDDTLAQEAHTKRNTGRQREVIKAKLRQAGFTDEEQVDKLAELEMERSKLRGLKTQRATNRLVEIEEEIKAVTDGDPYVFEEEDGAGVRKIMRFTRADAVFALAQDGISNPTESEIEAKQAELYNDALADIQAEDAVQERETAEVDVEEQARDGAEVGVEEEEAVVDEEEAAVDEEAEELAAQFEAEGTPNVETEEDGVKVVRREGAKNTAKQDRIVRQAQARVKSLAKLGINVALYQTTEQYNAATGKTGRGVYDNKTIHINLEKANSRTMGHEAFHAMFLERIKSTDADAKAAAMSAMQAIRKVVAKDEVLAPRIDQFLEAYNANEQIDEEALAEIFGYLTDGYPKLSAPKKNAVKNAIVELFYQMTGVRLSEKWTQGDQNILDLFNTLAAKVEAGEEIEAEDLAGFDVTEERKAELEARAANDERLGALQEKRKQAQQARDALISELTNLANITADVRVTAFLNNLSRKIGVKGLKKLEAEMRKVNKNEDLTAEEKTKRLDALEAKYEAELKKLEQARKDAQEAVDKQAERIKPKAQKILDKAESQSRIEEINAELRKITAKLKRDKNEAKRNYEGKELTEYVKMLEAEANEQRAKLKAEKAELKKPKPKTEAKPKPEAKPAPEVKPKKTTRKKLGEGVYLFTHTNGAFVLKKNERGQYEAYETDSESGISTDTSWGETFRTLREAVEWADSKGANRAEAIAENRARAESVEKAKGAATLRSLEQQLTQAKRELKALEDRGATDSMKAPVKDVIANLEAEIAQLTEKAPTKKKPAPKKKPKKEYDPTVDKTTGRKLTDRELEQNEIVNKAFDRIQKLGRSKADIAKRRYLGGLEAVIGRLNSLISAAERTGERNTFLAQDLRSVRANVGRAMNEFLDKTEGMSSEQVEALEARFESPYYEFFEALKTENPINAFEKTFVEALGKGGIVLTPSRSTAEASPVLKEVIEASEEVDEINEKLDKLAASSNEAKALRARQKELMRIASGEAIAERQQAEAAQRQAEVEGVSVEEFTKEQQRVERQRKDTLSREAKRELDGLKGKTDKASKAKRAELKEFMSNLGTMSVDEAQAKRTEGKLKAREQKASEFSGARVTELSREGVLAHFTDKKFDKFLPEYFKTGYYVEGVYFTGSRLIGDHYISDREKASIAFVDTNNMTFADRNRVVKDSEMQAAAEALVSEGLVADAATAKRIVTGGEVSNTVAEMQDNLISGWESMMGDRVTQANRGKLVLPAFKAAFPEYQGIINRQTESGVIMDAAIWDYDAINENIVEPKGDRIKAREQRDSVRALAIKYNMDEEGFTMSTQVNEFAFRKEAEALGLGIKRAKSGKYYLTRNGKKINPFQQKPAKKKAVPKQTEAQAKLSLEEQVAQEEYEMRLRDYQSQFTDFPAEMIEPSRLSPREQRESIEDATRGFSVEAVVKFAKERGYSNKAILAVRPEAQAAITAYEAQANRVNTEVDGIIEKTRERARRDKKAQAIDNKGRRTRYINDRIEEDVLEYLRGTKMYEEASDVGRENMERAARKRFRKLKAAPPVQRVLSIDNEGKAELKDQIKAMARSSKATAAEIRRLTSDFAKDVAELRKGGVLTAAEAALLIKRFGQVNPLNPVSVERFEAFVKKYFDRADYRADIAAINTLRKKAKANAGKKTGVNRDFMPMLETILRVSPELLPDVEIDGVPLIKEYRSILEELSKRKAVLDLRPRTELRNKLSQILTEIDKELSLKEDLKMKYEEFEAESERVGDTVSETIDIMVEEGEISSGEAAILKKYMRELAKEPTEIDEEAKEAERLKERNRNIAAIQALPALTTRFEMREENDLVRDFNALIKTDAVEALTDSEIKNILRVADNITNGFLPHMTEVLVEKMVAETRAKIVLEASSQTLPKTMVQFYNAAMAKVFPKRLLKRARRTPMKNFDQVMGNYKGTPIYDAIFRDTAGSYARYSSEITNIQERLRKLETKLYKSLGRDPNKVTRAKYVIGAYMMQKEFESNPDIRGVFSAKQLLKASIERSRSNEDIKYSERQGDMLESILKEIDELGEVEGKALSELMWEKMMTPAMKGVAKGMREINDELTDKAAFTAGVLRGIPFSPISQYFHRVVQAEQKKGVKDSVSIIEAISKNFKPSTRAKNLIQRSARKAPAVNFDPFVSVNRGSKYILVDYHLTRPIRTTRRVISRLGREQSEMTKQQRLAIGFLREATQSIDENVLTDAFVYDDTLAKVAQYIKKTGYQLVLASIPRAAVETFTNAYFGSLVEPASFIEGIKHVGPVSENAPSILRNVKSVQTTRLFPESDKSLKSGVVDQIRDSMNPTGADVKSGVGNVFGRLYNYTAQPFREGVGVIASKIITRPDQMISRPIWFGKFARTFRKDTGVDVDFDAIARNDEEYMTKYAEAIDNATKEADRTSVRAGATDNPYLSSLRYMGGRNRKWTQQAIATIDGYMMRFMITEFVSFRTGVQALVGNGTISREKGIRLMAGTFGRMMGYVMALSIIRDLIAKQFLDDDDDDLDLEKEVTDSFLSSVLTVMAGTRGQLARGIMAIGSEAINEYYIEENYDRPFEYKDRFAYPLLDLQKSNQTEKMLLEGLIRVSGPYAPAARAVVTGAKAAPGMMDKYLFDELKATEKGQEGQTNLERKLLLQSLGLLGLFPFYTDVYYNAQRYQNQIYDEVDDATPLEETLEYQMLQEIKEQQKEVRKALREESGE